MSHYLRKHAVRCITIIEHVQQGAPDSESARQLRLCWQLTLYKAL